MAWGDLSPAERAAYGNGVGPWWFPAWPRALLTRLSSTFFEEADWAHHDYGYATRTGSRFTCDMLFLRAMLRDAAALSTPLKMLGACSLAWGFWILVRLFGWASYGHVSAHP